MAMKKRKVTLVQPARGRGWVVSYRDWTNKRHRPSFATKKQAEAELNRIEVMLALQGATAGASVQPCQLVPATLKEAIVKYVAFIRAERVGDTPKVEKVHFECLYVYLSNTCHVRFVHQITREHLDQFKTHLRVGCAKTPPKKASTVNRYFATFGRFFGKAVDWRHIPRAAAEELHTRKLREETADIKVWPVETMIHALRVVPDWARGPLYFLIETGCRPIECEKLRFEDILFDQRLVRYRTYKGGVISEKFKPLSDGLLAHLFQKQAMERALGRGQSNELVFLSPTGRPIGKDTLNHRLRRLHVIKKGGLSLYGLRHSFADGLVDLGSHLTEIQKIMGHSSPDITTAYTHRKQSHLLESVNRLSAHRAKLGVVM